MTAQDTAVEDTTLRVFVPDLWVDKTLSVPINISIGALMMRLVSAVDVRNDWSDHLLWWPQKNTWMNRLTHSLVQYGATSNEVKLEFHRVHCRVSVQLPDLQIRELTMSLKDPIFTVVRHLCTELSIRHAEELSLMWLHRGGADSNGTLRNGQQNGNTSKRSSRFGSIMRRGSHASRPHSEGATPPSKRLSESSPYIPSSPGSVSAYGNHGQLSYASSTRSSMYSVATPNGSVRSPMFPISPSIGSIDGIGTLCASPSYSTMHPLSMNSLACEGMDGDLLSNSPFVPVHEALEYRHVPRFRSTLQRAKYNMLWLDSSRSIMEQGYRVDSCAYELLGLRFKYASIAALDPKYDVVRINQLFSQAKWSILTDTIECNEDQIMFFAGLQLQVQLQQTRNWKTPSAISHFSPESHGDEAEVCSSQGGYYDRGNLNGGNDEVDDVLAELEIGINGSVPANDSTTIKETPELTDNLKFFRPKKLHLRHYRSYSFVLRETTLRMYNKIDAQKSQAIDPAKENGLDQPANTSAPLGTPIDVIDLLGCEVVPDVNISARKYGIKLFVNGAKSGSNARQQSGLQEYWLRCNSTEQYARWSAACRLASKGRTMASKVLFDTEVRATIDSLTTQHSDSGSPTQPPLTPSDVPELDPLDYISPRFRRYSARQLTRRILEAHANLRQLSSLDAKLRYVEAWQKLPHYGLTIFSVRFSCSRKEEYICVGPDRIVRVDFQSGAKLDTWYYKNIMQWNTNWQNRTIQLTLDKHSVVFQPSDDSAKGCRIIHEYIGGHIYLSMRGSSSTKAKGNLNDALFFRLTGAVVPG